MSVELLDSARIRELLSPEAAARVPVIEVFPTIDSTNAAALRRIQCGNADHYICLAEQQTHGRGRHGRKWVSPPHANIYFSLVSSLYWTVPSALSLAVAAVIADRLSALGVDGIGLKWPNDLLWQDKKLGGILLEQVTKGDRSYQAVIGIGINVAMPPHVGQEIDRPWTTIQEVTGRLFSRNLLAVEMIEGLLPLLAVRSTDILAHWRRIWQQRDILCGKEIIVRVGNDILCGTAAGIDDDGTLCVHTAEKKYNFTSGEVSITSHQ